MALRLTLLSVRPSGAHLAVLDDLAESYLKRCGKDLAAEARVFRTEKLLLAHTAGEMGGGAARFWMADIGGIQLSSEGLANRMRDARDGGIRHVVLGVGPADGWSAEARASADLRISLSAMTLPHEIARLVLAEQIYRATTILQGHPYHLGH